MDRVADLAQVAQAEHAAGELADGGGQVPGPGRAGERAAGGVPEALEPGPERSAQRRGRPETPSSCRFALTASIRRPAPRAPVQRW